MTNFLIPTIALLLFASCALLPAPTPEEQGRTDDMDGFAREIREDMQDHEWQSLLASTNPEYYQARVVDGETPEPLYLAELLSIAREGNHIQEGDTLGWEDLDRIMIATLAPVGDNEDPYRYTGLATLDSGEELRLDVWVTTVQGRFVITPQPADGE